MPQKQIARRHHYIPEFYLKRWASKGRLSVYTKPYGGVVRTKPKYPKETGWIDKLYALDGVPEDRSSAFEEEFLSPVDHRASLVLAKMEANVRGFTSAERVAWTQFMLSLVLRHPENVKAVKDRLAETLLVVDQSAEKRWRAVRGASDPKTLAEALSAELARNPDSVSRHGLNLIAQTMASEKIGSHIINMKWGSLLMPVGLPELMTSDRPVHWFGALRDDNCHIIMPVGPKRIFYATNTLEMASTLSSVSPIEIRDFINSHTVRRAVSRVYAMSNSHVNYVQEFMGVDPEVTVADIITRKQPVKELRREKRKVAALRMRGKRS